MPGQHEPGTAPGDLPQRVQVAAQRVGVEAALEGDRRCHAGQQVVAGEQHLLLRRVQADVPEGVAGGVHDLPVPAADRQPLAAAQPGRRLDDGVQVGQPPAQVVGEPGQLRLRHAVVGVHVLPAQHRGVGVAVLLAVEVGQRVHPQLRTGQLHHPPGQAVVVDVRMGDDDA